LSGERTADNLIKNPEISLYQISQITFSSVAFGPSSSFEKLLHSNAMRGFSNGKASSNLTFQMANYFWHLVLKRTQSPRQRGSRRLLLKERGSKYSGRQTITFPSQVQIPDAERHAQMYGRQGRGK